MRHVAGGRLARPYGACRAIAKRFDVERHAQAQGRRNAVRQEALVKRGRADHRTAVRSSAARSEPIERGAREQRRTHDENREAPAESVNHGRLAARAEAVFLTRGSGSVLRARSITLRAALPPDRASARSAASRTRAVRSSMAACSRAA